MDTAVDHKRSLRDADRPRLSAWLWQPWYAKLWWTAIPLWWLGMALSTRVDVLATFYRSALAGYLNVLFFPMTALMVLSVGYVRKRLDTFVGPSDGMPLSDEEALAVTRDMWEAHERALEDVGASTDMFDPRSGALWIGNPNNPNNGAYINPHTGKHV